MEKQRSGKILKFFLLLLLCTFLVLPLFSCAGGSDLPPETGGEKLENLNGVFTSEHGSFVFNGDGRSIMISVDEEFSEKSGIPSGLYSGSYVFLFHNEEYDRNKAERLRITIDSVSYEFVNCPDATGKDRITAYFFGTENDPFTFVSEELAETDDRGS